VHDKAQAASHPQFTQTPARVSNPLTPLPRERHPESEHTHQSACAVAGGRDGIPGYQPLEPMLLPKLRIHFADFPWSHCSIDQRLFTSESGCGDRYGRFMLDRVCCVCRPRHDIGGWHTSLRAISGGAFGRPVTSPLNGGSMTRRFPVNANCHHTPNTTCVGGWCVETARSSPFAPVSIWNVIHPAR